MRTVYGQKSLTDKWLKGLQYASGCLPWFDGHGMPPAVSGIAPFLGARGRLLWRLLGFPNPWPTQHGAGGPRT
jgi:hypothetical protein